MQVTFLSIQFITCNHLEMIDSDLYMMSIIVVSFKPCFQLQWYSQNSKYYTFGANVEHCSGLYIILACDKSDSVAFQENLDGWSHQHFLLYNISPLRFLGRLTGFFFFLFFGQFVSSHTHFNFFFVFNFSFCFVFNSCCCCCCCCFGGPASCCWSLVR